MTKGCSVLLKKPGYFSYSASARTHFKRLIKVKLNRADVTLHGHVCHFATLTTQRGVCGNDILVII